MLFRVGAVAPYAAMVPRTIRAYPLITSLKDVACHMKSHLFILALTSSILMGCATSRPPAHVVSPSHSRQAITNSNPTSDPNSSNTQTSSSPISDEDWYSQKRSASKIYGDERLDKAYEEWAAKGYPHHPDSYKYELKGDASWYGPGLNGNKTANGDKFDMHGMSAAHKELPLGSIVVVTNLNTNKSVVVRINDRGPFVDGRVIDMSYGSAYLIDMVLAGIAPVQIEIISLGNNKYGQKW